MELMENNLLNLSATVQEFKKKKTKMIIHTKLKQV